MNTTQILNYVSRRVDEVMDDLFATVHRKFNTKSGDILPEQQIQLDVIKSDLSRLMTNQVIQNLESKDNLE